MATVQRSSFPLESGNRHNEHWLKALTRAGILMAVVPTVFALKIETNSLVLHDSSGNPTRALEFPSPITSGSSATSTPFGIVVTGPTASSPRSAFLWNGSSVQALPELNHTHICHGSVYFKGKVMVMGGLNEDWIETYQQGAGQWTDEGELPTAKANFACTVVGQKLYVVGGVGINGRYHDSILAFDGVNWEKLSVKVPKKIRGPGAFPVSESALLVFGGKVEDQNAKREDNLEVWVVDVRTLTVGVHGGALPLAGMYSAYQAVEETEHVAISGESAQVLLWNKAQRTFALASQ